MDRTEWIHKRKAKYMAQVLENFEQVIEPHLSSEAAGAIQDHKGLVRARMNALATDASEIMALGEDTAQNGLAIEIRDRLHPEGRPLRRP